MVYARNVIQEVKMEKVEYKSNNGIVGFSAIQCKNDDIKGNVEILLSWLHQYKLIDIYEIINELDDIQCLNEKGKKILEELRNKTNTKEYKRQLKIRNCPHKNLINSDDEKCKECGVLQY